MTNNDFNVKEAAIELGVQPAAVIRYINYGFFPGAYKLNPYAARRSPWRIPQTAIDDFKRKRLEIAKNNYHHPDTKQQ